MLAQKSGSFLLDDVVMTAHTRNGLNLRQRFFKRALDLFCASVGLVICSPLMLATAIAIKLDDGGSVFYKQKRMTRGIRSSKFTNSAPCEKPPPRWNIPP